MITTSAYRLAGRFKGTKEIAGQVNNPQIMAFLQLDNSWPQADEVSWCSAFVNWIAWLLELPRSKSLAARSWLKVGLPVDISEAQTDSDIVILKRGGGPGPEVLNAPGHVGFFAGLTDDGRIMVLGGNQHDSVNITAFPLSDLLGVRRL